jgi:uncharacterized lipoprotein YddW (UPF0748 family)
MNRRDLLKTSALGLLGMGCSRAGTSLDKPPAVATPAPAPSPPPRKKNWVWITLEREQPADAWKRDFARMREAGIDAILPEVYNGRHAYFASKRLPVKTERLEMMLPLARAEGLEVHAWMWSMPCLLEEIVKKHADWYNVNAKGESAADKPAYVDYYKFLDPARPEVREFVQGTVKELASYGELTGVHLDYIRHPDAILPKGLWKKYNLVQDRVFPEFDYGYSPYNRAAFKKAHGVDPIEIKDPTAHAEWMQYRFDSVTELVNRWLVPAAHAQGKKITAAVFPGPTLARQMVRQDWGRWDLDAFLPMLYNNFYEAGPEWVDAQTREGVATVKQPLYSGLFAHAVDAAGLRAIVEAALRAGASGVSLFSYNGMDEAKWTALSTTLRAHG